MFHTSGRSVFGVTLYTLLEPLPLGFFVAAWFFDILYLQTFVIMWTKSASWLIAIGLVLAILVLQSPNIAADWAFLRTSLAGRRVSKNERKQA